MSDGGRWWSKVKPWVATLVAMMGGCVTGLVVFALEPSDVFVLAWSMQSTIMSAILLAIMAICAIIYKIFFDIAGLNMWLLFLLGGAVCTALWISLIILAIVGLLQNHSFISFPLIGPISLTLANDKSHSNSHPLPSR